MSGLSRVQSVSATSGGSDASVHSGRHFRRRGVCGRLRGGGRRVSPRAWSRREARSRIRTFTTLDEQSTIDKVDVLFDIDNSASMGDKQAYLAQAIPDLVNRLVTPNCVKTVNDVTTITGPSHLDGSCDDPASSAEFAPVHNLHLGIVSSSLGPRLGDRCPSTGAPIPRRCSRAARRSRGTTTTRPTC